MYVSVTSKTILGSTILFLSLIISDLMVLEIVVIFDAVLALISQTLRATRAGAVTGLSGLWIAILHPSITEGLGSFPCPHHSTHSGHWSASKVFFLRLAIPDTINASESAFSPRQRCSFLRHHYCVCQSSQDCFWLFAFRLVTNIEHSHFMHCFFRSCTAPRRTVTINTLLYEMRQGEKNKWQPRLVPTIISTPVPHNVIYTKLAVLITWGGLHRRFCLWMP